MLDFLEIDSHGNRVWRWAKEVLESTSVLLKRLDNKDLELEPTQKVPVMGGADRTRQKQPPSSRSAAPRAAGWRIRSLQLPLSGGPRGRRLL